MQSTTKKVISVENSTWNNIGDAFYQYSLQNMISEALPEYDVVSIDGPPARAFRPGRYASNVFDTRSWSSADHIVFSGPILGRMFFQYYAEIIQAILRRGASYSLLSVHAGGEGADYDKIHLFLEKHPPKAIHTRDHPTFKKFCDLVECRLDGVCFAFFVSKLEQIPRLDPDQPYICSSFHSMREPEIMLSDAQAEHFLESGPQLEFSSRKLLPWRYYRHLEFNSRYPKEISRWRIVRPVHGFYPLPHLIFSRPNSYISYNPLNFLSAYKYCDGTISDRVHAGVVTLSFGHPSYVVRLDSRSALFDGIGIERHGELMVLPRENLENAYQKHLSWLKTDFVAAIEN